MPKFSTISRFAINSRFAIKDDPAPLLFASMSWGGLGQKMSDNTAAPLKEKRTGVEFAGEFCFHKKHNCPSITGVGTRTKKVAGIKSIDVYALSLYVDEAKIVHSLMQQRYFAHKTPEQIAKHPHLFQELCNAETVEKSLVLVISSGLVKRKNFLEALETRLAPPLAKLKESAVLETFKEQFDGVEFKKGLEISFTFLDGKTVTTMADGRELNTVHSKALSKTLLDLYLGKNPVSPNARDAFAVGLARMLASKPPV